MLSKIPRRNFLGQCLQSLSRHHHRNTLSFLSNVSLDRCNDISSNSNNNIPSIIPTPRWNSTTTTTPKPKKPKKKKPNYANLKADEGRVVLVQTTKTKGRRGKAPKLCTGCGTQVWFGTEEGISVGLQAVDATQSKQQQKKSRFLDAMDSQTYSKRQGADTGFLCDRCLHLRKNNVWKAYDALTDIDAEVFAKQLSYVVQRRRFGMCILVVDATDPEHSAMKGLRKSIGKTNCWLVLNKIDLLPRLHPSDIQLLRSKIERVVGTRFTNCLAVSAAQNIGIVALAEQLLRNLGGRDVFIVGAANVGKSTLVHTLSACIANAVKLVGRNYTKRRDIANNLAVTGSHLPGTTLQAVRIPCFRKLGHALWDTPGIINAKAIQYSIFPTHLMEPLSRPLAIPIPDENRKGRVRPGYSILIEAGWMHRSFLDQQSSNPSMEDGDDDPETVVVDDDEDDQPQPKKHQKTSSFTPSVPLGPDDCLGTPTVLARVDVVETEEPSLYVQAFLHPTLNVRIVPTREAPDEAVVSKEYVQYIEEKMGRPIKTGTVVSKPLAAYVFSEDSPKGEVRPTENECHMNSGRVYMDVSFASLGWLAFAHASPQFCIIPHCVKGSVFSKRRSLYPLNLAEQIANDPYEEMEPDDLDSEYTKQLLRRASEEGKRGGRRDSTRSPTQPLPGVFNDDYEDDLRYTNALSRESEDEWF